MQVPVGSPRSPLSKHNLDRPDKDIASLQNEDRQTRQRFVKGSSTPTSPQHSGSPSRQIESGLDVLDNNAVNFLMALIMSVGGILVAAWYWNVPFRTVLSP